MPPRVEYELTDVGYSLSFVLTSLSEWGEIINSFNRLNHLMAKPFYNKRYNTYYQ
nr:winged helix-turn-helix transcriptional regulator [Vagococcus luciliae]